ncbi:ABC transporter substrate-binding protein [Nonomuraea sp. MG754425]|uniref:ABC transporter substrate-binding protein n=1 Tax=Nonomuraea sp. MG754425 TaxID=2570319 RepID=UPI001F194475|nr:ABC transporter substrate-binding protein [Nonomuraea sp. MG754425]MCF6476073.1 ABC transporter substrate-binding protein [Nonomuraea sp. MG754425]
MKGGLTRLAGAGAALTLALAACGGVDTGGSAGTGGDSGGGQGEQRQITVTAFAGAWGELFKKSFVEPFERETGAKVNLVYGANAEWLTKLRAAGGENPPFDVIAFTPDASLPAASAGLLQPIDTTALTHWKELDPVLSGKSAYQGKQYGVPLTTGSTGLLYRTDHVKTAPKDWSDIFDKKYCGHVALPPLTYNPGLEFFSALVTSEGGKLSDPAAVDRAFTRLETLKGCVSAFPANAGSAATVIENGDAWIMPFWDGRAFALAEAGSPIGFTYPESGPVGALTSYFVASGTKNADLATKFLDHLTAAQNQKPFAEGTWYAAGNDSIDYSEPFEQKVEHGPEVFEKFTWVDYSVATPKLNEWQQRWNQIFG